MKEMMSDETHRKHALIRVSGIIVLLLVMLVSIASSEQTTIDSITINPDPAVYVNWNSGFKADFTVTVHVTNPPAGGRLDYGYGCGIFVGSVLIDNNGMGTFKGSIQIQYADGYGITHACPPAVRVYVFDDQRNIVASASKKIDTIREPRITWSNPKDIRSVIPLSSTQLNAVATFPSYGSWISVPGTFVYTPAEGTVLSEGTHTLHVDFTPTDTANYTTTTISKDVIIQVWDPVTPTITWSNPKDIIFGAPLTITQLNAVSSPSCAAGTFVYTPAEGTVLSEGTHTLHVDFTPTDTFTYTTASKEVTINVLTHVQKIQQIATAVQSLNLIPEQANLLIVKLDTATQNLNKENTIAATNELNAFINQVNADINNGKISSTEGQALIDDTNGLISAINILNPPKKPIPEFPTIALPMFAIIGIIVIIGRRRE